MLSRTLDVMFKVKQLFTENYLLLLHITLFVVHFNSIEVIRSQYFVLLLNNIEQSLKFQPLLSKKILLHQPNFTLAIARNMHAFHCYSYSENAI